MGARDTTTASATSATSDDSSVSSSASSSSQSPSSSGSASSSQDLRGKGQYAPPRVGGMGRIKGFRGYLCNFQALNIRQVPKGWGWEMVCGWEIKNVYNIFDAYGPQTQPILIATESSSCVQKQCCGPYRRFDMHINDPAGNEIARVHRPFKCGCWCRDSWMRADSYGGQMGGPTTGLHLGQTFNKYKWCPCVSPIQYGVVDPQGDEIADITGPSGCCACGNVVFKIFQNGQETGTIGKRWSGIMKEAFTDSENFYIIYPPNADEADRVNLLGALFLIDFMWFEKQK